MNKTPIINLAIYRKIVEETSIEIQKEFAIKYFDNAGMIQVKSGDNFRYSCTPLNTEVFAYTGGDGVHYSIFELSVEIQPVVMTVPMALGNSIKSYNKIIGENLNEFLSLGYYNGWFPLEQLCYDPADAIEFYSKENMKTRTKTSGKIYILSKT